MQALSKLPEPQKKAGNASSDPHLDIVMEAFNTALRNFQRISRQGSEEDDSYMRTFMTQVGCDLTRASEDSRCANPAACYVLPPEVRVAWSNPASLV